MSLGSGSAHVVHAYFEGAQDVNLETAPDDLPVHAAACVVLQAQHFRRGMDFACFGEYNQRVPPSADALHVFMNRVVYRALEDYEQQRAVRGGAAAGQASLMLDDLSRPIGAIDTQNALCAPRLFPPGRPEPAAAAAAAEPEAAAGPPFSVVYEKLVAAHPGAAAPSVAWRVWYLQHDAGAELGDAMQQVMRDNRDWHAEQAQASRTSARQTTELERRIHFIDSEQTLTDALTRYYADADPVRARVFMPLNAAEVARGLRTRTLAPAHDTASPLHPMRALAWLHALEVCAPVRTSAVQRERNAYQRVQQDGSMCLSFPKPEHAYRARAANLAPSTLVRLAPYDRSAKVARDAGRLPRAPSSADDSDEDGSGSADDSDDAAHMYDGAWAGNVAVAGDDAMGDDVDWGEHGHAGGRDASAAAARAVDGAAASTLGLSPMEIMQQRCQFLVLRERNLRKRNDAARQYEHGTDEYYAEMQALYDAAVPEFWAVLNEAENLSRPILTARKWYQALAPERRWYASNWTFENLTPIGNCLAGLHNRLSRIGRIHTGHRLLMVAHFCSNGAGQYGFHLKLNYLMMGDGSSGKSHILEVIERTKAPGFVRVVSHVSPHAFATDEDHSDIVLVFHEVPLYMLGINSQGKDTGVADPMLKDRMTRQMSETMTFHKDDKTGVKRTVDSFARVMHVILAASNDPRPSDESALGQRWIQAAVARMTRSDLDVHDLDNVQSWGRSDATTERLEHELKLHHWYVMVVEKAIEAGALPDVNMDAATYVIRDILHHLHSEYKLRTGDPRKVAQVVMFTRQVVLWCAVDHAYFGETAVRNRWQRTGAAARDFQPMSLVHDVLPRMVCSEEHVYYAISLLEELWVPHLLTRIVHVFAHDLNKWPDVERCTFKPDYEVMQRLAHQREAQRNAEQAGDDDPAAPPPWQMAHAAGGGVDDELNDDPIDRRYLWFKSSDHAVQQQVAVRVRDMMGDDKPPVREIECVLMDLRKKFITGRRRMLARSPVNNEWTLQEVPGAPEEKYPAAVFNAKRGFGIAVDLVGRDYGNAMREAILSTCHRYTRERDIVTGFSVKHTFSDGAAAACGLPRGTTEAVTELFDTIHLAPRPERTMLMPNYGHITAEEVAQLHCNDEEVMHVARSLVESEVHGMNNASVLALDMPLDDAVFPLAWSQFGIATDANTQDLVACLPQDYATIVRSIYAQEAQSGRRALAAHRDAIAAQPFSEARLALESSVYLQASGCLVPHYPRSYLGRLIGVRAQRHAAALAARTNNQAALADIGFGRVRNQERRKRGMPDAPGVLHVQDHVAPAPEPPRAASRREPEGADRAPWQFTASSSSAAAAAAMNSGARGVARSSSAGSAPSGSLREASASGSLRGASARRRWSSGLKEAMRAKQRRVSRRGDGQVRALDRSTSSLSLAGSSEPDEASSDGM